MADGSARNPSNIYTVLALIAFLVLAAGIGYICVRSSELFGSSNPFEVPKNTSSVSGLTVLA